MALRPNRPQSRAEQIAQRDAAQQESFLREVDEALREDEVFGVFKRHGKTIGVAVVLGLSALAGGLWWNSHRESVKAERAEQLVLAIDKLDGGQPDAAFAQFGNIAKDGGDGTQAAARLLQAAIAGRKGNAAAAASLYQSVADDGDAPKPYRDLATVRGVALQFDTMKPDDVVAKLKPLSAPGNPWFGSAGELLAGAYLKQGRKDLAGPLLVTIARDKRVAESLRARTRQLAGLIGFDAIDDIAKAPEENAVASGAGAAQQAAQMQAQQAAQAQAQQAAMAQQAAQMQAAQAQQQAGARPAPKPTVPANVGPITVNLPSASTSAPAAPAAPSSKP